MKRADRTWSGRTLWRASALGFALTLPASAHARTPATPTTSQEPSAPAPTRQPPPGPSAPSQRAATSTDLVRRALASNGELAAARLDVERARARLRQAGLRPNPTIDVEHTTGRFTGAAGERETTVGVAVPLELFGQRSARVDLAEAEIEAAEAEISDRERRLAAEVRALYAGALAAARELEVTDELADIDQATAKLVEVRVTEGESAPIELRLLQVEMDRQLSRRAVVEGRLQASLLELRSLAGAGEADPVSLGERIERVAWPGAPATLAEAQEIAMRTRPDLRLARLQERVAAAGLRLARTQSAPEVTAFGRVSVGRSIFDDTPVGTLVDRDKTLSAGVSIGLPVFNRNQGARAEAEAAITQAERRRAYAEQRVRAEVAAAFARVRAAERAVATFEGGVIARSNQNLRSIRGAYEIGAYRMTELLAEQRRFVDAEREYVETLEERYRALADLQSAMGLVAPFGERAPAAAPALVTSTGGPYPGLDSGATPAPVDEPAPRVRPPAGRGLDALDVTDPAGPVRARAHR